MTIQIPSGSIFFADTSNETYVLAAEDSLSGPPNADTITSNGVFGGRTFNIFGTISSSLNGISVFNDPAQAIDRVFVGKTGSIDGDEHGIALEGRGVIQNAGIISSGETAILTEGAFARCINSGLVRGGDGSGIIGNSDDFVLRNTGAIFTTTASAVVAHHTFDIRNTGTVASRDGVGMILGIGISSDGGRLVNEGTISGSNNAITGNDGAVDGNHYEIVNRGTILGNLIFSNAKGDDVFDMAGGSLFGRIQGGAGDNLFILTDARITGPVSGGLGDDIFVVSNSTIALAESASSGTDTVRANVDFSLRQRDNFENLILIGGKDIDGRGNTLANVVTGNRGDNQLFGIDGADTLRGGRGNDTLDGGSNGDIFIFKTGDGKDVILGFQALTVDKDKIDLSQVGAITDFDDLRAHHLSEKGGDVLIKAGKDVITIDTLDIDALSADNFIF